jgi:hypothetical protein
VRLGWGHARTALAYGVVMAACAVLASTLREFAPDAGWSALVAASVLLGLAWLAVDRRWARRGLSE